MKQLAQREFSVKEDITVCLWDDGNESVARGKLMKDGGAIAGAE